MNQSLKIIAVILLLFLGVGGIYGAVMLLSDQTGGKFGWPPDLLEATPFESYMLPGILLMTFNGLLPLIVSFGLIIKWRYAPGLISLQGIILLIWLVAQLLINPEFFVPSMHYPFFILALLLLPTGLILHRQNSKSKSLINSNTRNHGN